MHHILEGVKTNRALINAALNDPNFTFGFEVEFYVVGAQAAIQQHLTKGLETRDEGGGRFYVKKLGDMTYYDVLHFWQPLGVPRTEIIDNEEIIDRRISSAYKKITGEESTDVPPHKIWEFLKKKYQVHQLMAIIRALPKGRMMGIPENQRDVIIEIVYDGDLEEITPFGKLNDMDIATAEAGYEHEDYNISNSATRAAAYNLIAEQLSKKLGQDIISTPDSMESYPLSQGYKRWILTSDSSLTPRETKEDVVGCELISPVFQAQEGIQWLMKVLEIMQGSVLELDIKTTYETGLHINLGIKDKEIDALKMLILLGDEHIAKQFDRIGGDYSSPVAGELERRLGNISLGKYPTLDVSEKLMRATHDILRKIRIEQSDFQRLITHMDQIKPSGKNYSVNFKLPEYVEFRSIGNRNYENRANEIRDAVLRMIVITYIATDPDAYHKEFLKKVYSMTVRAITNARQPLAASTGPWMVGHSTRGGYGIPASDVHKDIGDPDSPYDGEKFIQYGFDPGSDTQ